MLCDTVILWMEEILHQLIGGKHPIIYRLSTIQGGAGFLPSTVVSAIYPVHWLVPTTAILFGKRRPNYKLVYNSIEYRSIYHKHP